MNECLVVDVAHLKAAILGPASSGQIATSKATKPGGMLNGEDGWKAACPVSGGPREKETRSDRPGLAVSGHHKTDCRGAAANSDIRRCCRVTPMD